MSEARKMRPQTVCAINIALMNRHIKEFQNNVQTRLPEEIGNIHDSIAILSSLQQIFSLEPTVQPLHVLSLVNDVHSTRMFYCVLGHYSKIGWQGLPV
jgi:hypothetical protein